MKFKRFIKREYQIRHAILEELFKSSENEENPQDPQVRVDTVKVANLTNISIKDITNLHEYLDEEEEIDCCFDKGNPAHKMLITSKGRQSYINKKYLTDGRKAYWDKFYDPGKIVVPLAALIISIGSLFYSMYSNDKIIKLKKQVESQQDQLDSLLLIKPNRVSEENY